jgi:hypothetical protein
MTSEVMSAVLSRITDAFGREPEGIGGGPNVAVNGGHPRSDDWGE